MKEKILIVDDEIEVCNALKEFLSLKEYEVETALDGPTAIKKLKVFNPHVVLLDMIMPKMGGIDVLMRIRDINPRVGIIMVTAIKDDDIAKKAVGLGAYDYITKPLNLHHLETVVAFKMVDVLSSEQKPINH